MDCVIEGAVVKSLNKEATYEELNNLLSTDDH